MVQHIRIVFNKSAVLRAALLLSLLFLHACKYFSGDGKLPVSDSVDYVVSLKPLKPIAHFEDKKIPINLFFTVCGQAITKGNVKFRIKDVEIKEGIGHLETSKGETLKSGLEFQYATSKHQLFFVPDQEGTPGNVKIKLEVLLIENGSEAPASTHKKTNCTFHIQRKSEDFTVVAQGYVPVHASEKGKYDPNIFKEGNSVIPIELTLQSNATASSHNYVVSSWSVSGGNGQLYHQNGSVVMQGCQEVLVLGKNNFVFSVDSNVAGKLTLSVEVMSKTTNNKKKVDVIIDVQNREVRQDHEIDIEATLIPLDTNHRSHKASKFELAINSKSELGGTLQYKILAIQLSKGSLRLTKDGADLKSGDELKFGKQELFFIPDGFSGKFNPVIIIQNSKSSIVTVELKGKSSDYEFKNSNFFAKAACSDQITLTLGGDNLIGNEKWILEDWHFQGGIQGDLQYKIESRSITKKSKFKFGDTFIHLLWDKKFQNIHATPLIVFSMLHPSGMKQELKIDLSSLVFPVLKEALDTQKTSLENLITPIKTNDLAINESIKILEDTQKALINTCKEIIIKIGYMVGLSDTLKEQSENLVRAYTSFLSTHLKFFKAVVDTANTEHQATHAIERANTLSGDDSELILRLKKDKEGIDTFLSFVDGHQDIFSNLTDPINNIKVYLGKIVREIRKVEANKRAAADNFSRDLQQALEERDHLKSQLTDLNNNLFVYHNDTEKRLQHELSLKAAIEQKNRQILELNDSFQSVNENLQNESALRKESENKIQEILDKQKELMDSANNFSEQLNNSLALNLELESHLSDLREKLSNTSSKSDLEEVVSQKNALEQDKCKLESRLKDLENNLSASHISVEKRLEHELSLKAAIEQRDRQIRELDDSLKTAKESLDRESVLRKESESKIQEILDKQQHLMDSANHFSDQLKNSLSRNANLEKELSDLRNKLLNSTSKAELEVVLSQKMGIEHEKKLLEAKLEESEQNLSLFRADAVNKLQYESSLKEAIGQKDGQIDGFNDRLQSLNENLQNESKLRKESENKITEILDKQKELINSANHFSDQLKNSLSRNTDLEKELSDMREKLSNTTSKAELEVVLSQKIELDKQKKDLSSKLQDLESSLSILRLDTEKRKEEELSLKKMVQQQEMQMQELNNRLQSADSKLQDTLLSKYESERKVKELVDAQQKSIERAKQAAINLYNGQGYIDYKKQFVEKLMYANNVDAIEHLYESIMKDKVFDSLESFVRSALEKRNPDIVEYLLNKVDDINLGLLCLYIKSNWKDGSDADKKIVEMLLQKGIDVNYFEGIKQSIHLYYHDSDRRDRTKSLNVDGVYAIHLAASSKNISAYKFLLEKGADPNIKVSVLSEYSSYGNSCSSDFSMISAADMKRYSKF